MAKLNQLVHCSEYHRNDQVNCWKKIKEFDPPTQTWIRDEVERRVEDALIREERRGSQRKARLREQLIQDNKKISCEIEPVKSYAAIKKVEEAEKKLFNLETRKERERLEEVERRRALQKILNCEEARQSFSKEQERLIKHDQLWQINQKIMVSSQKAKEAEAYNEQVFKDIEQSLKEQEEERKKYWNSKMEAKSAYLQQIEWKNQRKQQKIREKEKEKLEFQIAIEANKELEIQELRERKKKSEELGAELKVFMERERALRQKRIQDEKAMENQISIFGSETFKEDKETHMKQFEAYKESLEELRSQRRQEERKFDERLQKLSEEIDEKKRNENTKIQQAREELKRCVIKGRLEQIEMKNDTLKRNVQQEAMEQQQILKAVSEYQLDMCKAKELDREQRRQYAEYLRRQMKDREDMRMKEKNERQMETNKMIEEKARHEKELEDLVNNASKLLTHPLRGVKCASFFIPSS